jgi:hypothetical protein
LCRQVQSDGSGTLPFREINDVQLECGDPIVPHTTLELPLPRPPGLPDLQRLAQELGVDLSAVDIDLLVGNWIIAPSSTAHDALHAELQNQLAQRIECLLVMPLESLGQTILRPGDDYRAARGRWLGWRRWTPAESESPHAKAATSFRFWGKPPFDGDGADSNGPADVASFRGALLVSPADASWIGWEGGQIGWNAFQKIAPANLTNARVVDWGPCPEPLRKKNWDDPLPFIKTLSYQLAEMLLTGADHSWLELERMGASLTRLRTDGPGREAEIEAAQAALSNWRDAYEVWFGRSREHAKLEPAIAGDPVKMASSVERVSDAEQALSAATDDLSRKSYDWLARSRNGHTLRDWRAGEHFNTFLSRVLLEQPLPVRQSVQKIGAARKGVLVPGVVFSDVYHRAPARDVDEPTLGSGADERYLRVAWALRCDVCRRVRNADGGCGCAVPPPVFDAVYWYFIDHLCQERQAWRCTGNCPRHEEQGGPLHIININGVGPSARCPSCGAQSWAAQPVRVHVPRRQETWNDLHDDAAVERDSENDFTPSAGDDPTNPALRRLVQAQRGFAAARNEPDEEACKQVLRDALNEVLASDRVNRKIREAAQEMLHSL